MAYTRYSIYAAARKKTETPVNWKKYLFLKNWQN